MRNFKIWLEAKTGLEGSEQILWAIGDIRANLYYRTRPFKPHPHDGRNTPVDHLGYWLKKMKMIRDWVVRNDFQVTHRHIDEAISALSDAMISLHQNPDPNFIPASYHKGADPKNAETLQQFSTFLTKRVNQKPVIHPLLSAVAEAWNAFHDDFKAVYDTMPDEIKKTEY